MQLLLLVVLAAAAMPAWAAGDDLDRLSTDFWTWRAGQQPGSGDDIPRIERPDDWVPDWSTRAIDDYRKTLAEFVARHRALDSKGWSRARQVDARLIGSALARVHWELDVERSWQRNPTFYLHQTLGTIHDALLQPPPLGASRRRAILTRMAAIPRTVEQAKLNLDGKAVRPFAELTIQGLEKVRPTLQTVAKAVQPMLDPAGAAELAGHVEKATTALEDFRTWLIQRLPTFSRDTAVGRPAYEYFLKQVAMIPYSPEQLLLIGRQEWDRSVAFETYERLRNQGVPPLLAFRRSGCADQPRGQGRAGHSRVPRIQEPAHRAPVGQALSQLADPGLSPGPRWTRCGR